MNKKDVRALVLKQLQNKRAKESFAKMHDERVKVLKELKNGLNPSKGTKSRFGKEKDEGKNIYGETPSAAMIDEEGKGNE